MQAQPKRRIRLVHTDAHEELTAKSPRITDGDCVILAHLDTARSNGHPVAVTWNVYENHAVVQHHWGERIVILRTDLEADIRAALKKYRARKNVRTIEKGAETHWRHAVAVESVHDYQFSQGIPRFDVDLYASATSREEYERGLK